MADRTVPRAAAPLTEWLDAVARPAAAPAGGAAAALGAALGAAAVELVAGLTLDREGYAAAHPRAADARREAAELRETLVALAVRDAEAFAEFTRALALPRSPEPERQARERAKHDALRRGAELQLDVLRRTARISALALELAEHGLATALGDAASGAFLAAAAARSAYWAARANLVQVAADDELERRLAAGLALLEEVETRERRIRQLAQERIR